jgi:hypothetical protein
MKNHKYLETRMETEINQKTVDSFQDDKYINKL